MKSRGVFKLILTLMVIFAVSFTAMPAATVSAHAVQSITSVHQTQAPAPMDLQAFLQWLIGGGGSIVAVSWLLERMKWFQALSSDAKDYTIFGFSIMVGCSALVVVTHVPPAVLDAIAPYFLIIASTFAAVFIAKVFHRVDKSG